MRAAALLYPTVLLAAGAAAVLLREVDRSPRSPLAWREVRRGAAATCRSACMDPGRARAVQGRLIPRHTSIRPAASARPLRRLRCWCPSAARSPWAMPVSSWWSCSLPLALHWPPCCSEQQAPLPCAGHCSAAAAMPTQTRIGARWVPEAVPQWALHAVKDQLHSITEQYVSSIQPPPWPLFRLRTAVTRRLPLLVARLQPPTATAHAVGMGFAHSKALYAGERLDIGYSGWGVQGRGCL